MSSNTIYLKDNLLNIYHDFSNGEYSFTSGVGEFNDRFEITFNNSSLSINDELINSNFFTIVELADGSTKFKVNNTFTISNIEILDLLGRTIYNINGSSHEEIHFLPQLQQSTYLVKAKLSNDQVLVKKIIKK
jgi:hypothetical protein